MNLGLQNKLNELHEKKLSKEDFKIELVKFFNEEHITELDPQNLSYDNEGEIQKWLNKSGVFLKYQTDWYFKKDIFFNDFDKINFSLQSECNYCRSREIKHFPIRIAPKSYQSSSSLLRKHFKEEVKKSYGVLDENFKIVNKICLKLIFVINDSRDKDVDNMAKLLNDALKNHLFSDDINIDHLEVFKFKSVHIEEHILVRIGQSEINNRDDVIFDNPNMKFISPKIDL